MQMFVAIWDVITRPMPHLLTYICLIDRVSVFASWIERKNKHIYPLEMQDSNIALIFVLNSAECHSFPFLALPSHFPDHKPLRYDGEAVQNSR